MATTMPPGLGAAPPANYDFMFTRDQRTDYQFVRRPAGGTAVEQAILQLQDYFPNLIDGRGYFSFPVAGVWVTAEVVKTTREDHVGRPVYEIRGWVHPLDQLGHRWYQFAAEAAPGIHKAYSFTGGEFPANPRYFGPFLQYCATYAAPFGWAYGVRPAAADGNDLNFQVRFVSPDAIQKPKTAAGPRPGGFRRWVRRLKWLTVAVLSGAIAAMWVFAPMNEYLSAALTIAGLLFIAWMIWP